MEGGGQEGRTDSGGGGGGGGGGEKEANRLQCQPALSTVPTAARPPAEDSFAGNDRVLLGGGDLANDLTCQSLRRVAGEDRVRLGGGAGRGGAGWGGVVVVGVTKSGRSEY